MGSTTQCGEEFFCVKPVFFGRVIVGGLIIGGGIRDIGAFTIGLHGQEAWAIAAFAAKRVVTASVKDEDAETGAAVLKFVANSGCGVGLVGKVGLRAGKVNWDQVVLIVCLDAVTRVIKECEVAAAKGGSHAVNFFVHLAFVEIMLFYYLIEIEVTERLRHCGGVVDGIDERAGE